MTSSALVNYHLIPVQPSDNNEKKCCACLTESSEIPLMGHREVTNPATTDLIHPICEACQKAWDEACFSKDLPTNCPECRAEVQLPLKTKIFRDLKTLGKHMYLGAYKITIMIAWMSVANLVINSALAIFLGLYTGKTMLIIPCIGFLARILSQCTSGAFIGGALGGGLASAVLQFEGASLTERKKTSEICGQFSGLFVSTAWVIIYAIKPEIGYAAVLGYATLPVIAIAGVAAAVIALKKYIEIRESRLT